MTQNLFVAFQFKGEQGNFYNDIPYRLVRPFDEIYQFAADMGERVIFSVVIMTPMHAQPCSINLNVLEEVRKLNDFNGEVKSGQNVIVLLWNNLPKFSTVLRACMYPSMLKKKQTILIERK